MARFRPRLPWEAWTSEKSGGGWGVKNTRREVLISIRNQCAPATVDSSQIKSSEMLRFSGIRTHTMSALYTETQERQGVINRKIISCTHIIEKLITKYFNMRYERVKHLFSTQTELCIYWRLRHTSAPLVYGSLPELCSTLCLMMQRGSVIKYTQVSLSLN